MTNTNRRRWLRLAPIAATVLAVCSNGAWAKAAEPPAAPPALVKASDAPGLLAVIRQAGFKARLTPREAEDDDPSIVIETRDGKVQVLFEDCADAIPDLCETLVLSASWDRTAPMSDTMIAEANRNFRYVSIWRDADGDPVVQWAILTGEHGIAPPLFLGALQRYFDIVRDFDAVAFVDDTDADAAPTT